MSILDQDPTPASRGGTGRRMSSQAGSGAPPPGQQGMTRDHAVAASGILGFLSHILETLKDIASSPPEVAYGATGTPQRVANFPIPGRHRIVVTNRSGGQPAFPLPATTNPPTDIMDVDKGRAGLSIINTGAFPAMLFLSKSGDTQGGAVGPSLWLAANGAGTFDGKISDELWCGALCGYGIGGATTLAIAVI